MEKKFVLEFDEAPALVFVSHDGRRNEEMYVRGEKEFAWRSVTIRSSLDEFTTHEVEYLSIKKREASE
ncbi:hypothetical protein [Mesobacillus zeae]|uniref:hypothetical protein n=1 Tax=Mesobacillus zeae TaxID=1917180 RepID=UPI00300BC5A4